MTLVISATFGFTRPLVQAISPGALAPSSITAWRCSAVRRSSVSGTPMSLLRLPWVARVPSPSSTAIISFTVVLPALPVTATRGTGNWAA